MSLKTLLKTNGFAILAGAVDPNTVTSLRQQISDNFHLMANTRPNPASRHIAGFERYTDLAPVHETLESNAALNLALDQIYGSDAYDTIGLSDITVNRSQPWHTDLLRGKYASYLTPAMCWNDTEIGCLKALLYLQDGKSLKVVPGSHKKAISLADDSHTVPKDQSVVQEVDVAVGDIILMDIRLMHRGSTEDEMRLTDLTHRPKILVSTVFGAKESALSDAMRKGNAHRMQDWEATHLVTK